MSFKSRTGEHFFLLKTKENANPATKISPLDGAVPKHILQMYFG